MFRNDWGLETRSFTLTRNYDKQISSSFSLCFCIRSISLIHSCLYVRDLATNFQKKYVSWLQDRLLWSRVQNACARLSLSMKVPTVPTGFSYWHRIDLVYECIVSSSKWDRWISLWLIPIISREKKSNCLIIENRIAFIWQNFFCNKYCKFIYIFIFFLIVYITGYRTN